MVIRVADGPADRLAPQSFEHVYDMPEWTIFELFDVRVVRRGGAGALLWFRPRARSPPIVRSVLVHVQVLGEPMTGFRALFEVAP
jgi:hypothetical protein